MWSALLFELFPHYNTLFRFLSALAVVALQPVRAFFFFRCSFAAFSPFLQNSPYIQAGNKKHQSSHFGVSGAIHNTALPGGRRVRGFVDIEPIVRPCP